MLEGDDMAEETEEVSTTVGLFLGILMLSQIVVTTMEQRCPTVMMYVPEVGVIIVVGILASVVVNAAGIGDTVDVFDPTIFFVGLLPPIIFNSGYHLKRQLFFSNVPAIFTLAICGTITSAVMIAYGLYGLSQAGLIGNLDLTAAQCWTFGALISATDPVSTLVLFAELRVEPNLFYLVFGESVMNDAVGLVLFETTREFIKDNKGTTFILNSVVNFCVVLVGSLILGAVLSVIMAWIIRRAAMRNNPVLEQGLFLNFIFMPYVIGEVCNLSGIVTTLTAGLAARKFLAPNLNEQAEMNFESLLRVTANLAETAAFLDLGLTCVQYSKTHYRPLLWLWAVILCSISRPVMVYLYSNLLNWVMKREEVSRTNQHMIGFAGLRGVVAFACATMWPHDDDMRKIWISTTSLVVLFTVFVQGGLTPNMLAWLKVPLGCDENLTPVKPYPPGVKWCIRLINHYIVPSTNPARGNYTSDLEYVPDTTSVDTGPEQQMTGRRHSKVSWTDGVAEEPVIDDSAIKRNLTQPLDGGDLGESLLPGSTSFRRVLSTPTGGSGRYVPEPSSTRRRSVYDFVNQRIPSTHSTGAGGLRTRSQGYVSDMGSSSALSETTPQLGSVQAGDGELGTSLGARRSTMA